MHRTITACITLTNIGLFLTGATTIAVFVIVISTTLNTFYIVYCCSFIVCYFVIGGFATTTPTFEKRFTFCSFLWRLKSFIHNCIDFFFRSTTQVSICISIPDTIFIKFHSTRLCCTAHTDIITTGSCKV